MKTFKKLFGLLLVLSILMCAAVTLWVAAPVTWAEGGSGSGEGGATSEPTETPASTAEPTAEPTVEPTETPASTAEPTAEPTTEPVKTQLTPPDVTGNSHVYDGKVHTASASVDVSEGTTFHWSIDDGNSWSTTAPSIQNVGKVSFRVYATNPDYADSAKVDGTLEITPLQISVKADDVEVEYDGKTHEDIEANLQFDGILSGHTATIEYTFPGAKLVGTYNGEYKEKSLTVVTASNENVTENYTLISPTVGTLTIKDRSEKYQIEVVAKSSTNTYDGTEKSVEGFETLEFTVEGNTYFVSGLETSDPSQTDITGADGIVNEISGTPIVKDQDGNVVTTQFSVKLTNGKLKISPCGVTLTAGSAKKEYDGTPLTSAEFAVEGLAKTDKHTFTVEMTESSTITNYKSEGQANIIATVDGEEVTTGVAKAIGNYIVTVENGTLEIIPRQISVKADDVEVEYDGLEHTVSASSDGPDDTTIQWSVNGGDTWSEDAPSLQNVGIVSFKVKATPTDSNYAESDEVEGTLKILPCEVALTAGSAEKDYDSTPLTSAEFAVDGLAKTDKHTFTVEMTESSTITNYKSGGQPNIIATVDGEEVTAGVAKTIGNYIVTVKNGTLTINRREVTLTAGSAEKDYDGTPLTSAEFAVEGPAKTDKHTFTVEMTESSTITNYKSEGQPNIIATVDGEKVTEGEKNAVGNYIVTVKNGRLTINRREVTLTAGSAEKDYDGTPLTSAEFAVDGPAKTDRHTFTVEMTKDSTLTYYQQKGQPNVIATVDGEKVTAGEKNAVGNYIVTVTNGNLTINKVDLILTANDQWYVYNRDFQGENKAEYSYAGQSDTRVVVEGLQKNDTLQYTLNGYRKNAGTYDLKVSAPKLGDAQDSYNIKLVDAVLEIRPAVIETAELSSTEETYDAEDWNARLYTEDQTAPEEKSILMTVTTKADKNWDDSEVKSMTLTSSEYKIAKEEWINIGTYSAEWELTDKNFKVEGKQIVPTLTVKRAHVKALQHEGGVTSRGVSGFWFGKGHTMTLTASEGEVVEITFSNKDDALELLFGDEEERFNGKTAKIVMTCTDDGIVINGETVCKWPGAQPNQKVFVGLRYVDENNLTDAAENEKDEKDKKAEKDEDQNPEKIEKLEMVYDTTPPQLPDDANKNEFIDGTFDNRSHTLTVKLPENGKMVAKLQMKNGGEIEGEVKEGEETFWHQDLSKDPKGELNFNWVFDNVPSNGDDVLLITYTDLVGNETTQSYSVPKATGLAIVANDSSLDPGKARLDRLDMAGNANGLTIRVEGTAGEEIVLSLGGNTYPGTLSKTGEYSLHGDPGVYEFYIPFDDLDPNQELIYSVNYVDINKPGAAEGMFVYDPDADDIILMTGPIAAEEFPIISGLMEPNSSIYVLHNGEAVKNTATHRYISSDQFGVFTIEFPFLLKEGDDVVIQCRDAANNINRNQRFTVGAPAYELELKAYAMGKVFKMEKKDAQAGEDAYEWLMAARLTREELEAGVTLHMAAACAFDLGTVDLKLVNNELVVTPPLEDANIVIQSVGALDQKAMLEGGIHISANPEDKAFWVMVEQDVVLDSEQASESFQLSASNENSVRQEYMDRQHERRIDR